MNMRGPLVHLDRASSGEIVELLWLFTVHAAVSVAALVVATVFFPVPGAFWLIPFGVGLWGAQR